VCDIVVKRFTFAISSPDDFLLALSGNYGISLVYLYNVAIGWRPFQRALLNRNVVIISINYWAGS